MLINLAMRNTEDLQAKIEAFDGLAAHARYHAHLLRQRWWRAYLDAESVTLWQEKIEGAERRALEAQVNADSLRAILRAKPTVTD